MRNPKAPKPATVTTTRSQFLDAIAQVTTFADELKAGGAKIAGDASALPKVFANLDSFSTGFPVVEP
ncbi:MAG: hypothetical protein FJW19_03375 [Actinobacteria bacterium]|nr:hypothetical protein [Actinomycetota bacterium]